MVNGTTSNPPSSTLTISNVQETSTTTSTSQIVWTTNVAADSVVNYGTTPTYGSSTPVNSAMVTNHQVVLSGLTPGTTYYYEVASTDSKGNHGKSGGHSFKTLGFSISGTISPVAGGNGATLTLTGAANSTTTSDSSGNYTFTGLLNGAYTISPSHAGFTFTPSSQSTTINSANVTGVNFTDTAASAAPTITTQPASQTLTAGQTATFTVVATGTAPLSYQWSRNGAAISGATSSTYTTPTTTSSDSGAQFAVVVSNSAGSVTSAIATLTVTAAAVAPTITTQPTNQTVIAGQAATFTVVATGTGPLNYQWQKNGANIAGANLASYITAATTTSDSGAKFDVVVSNSAGTVTSTTATLTVNGTAVAPTITTQPANQTVTAGQTATFTVVATGAAPLSYQWSKNGTAVSSGTSSTYTTPSTISSDSGAQFTVVVSNTAGSITSNAAILTVNTSSSTPQFGHIAMVVEENTNYSSVAGTTAMPYLNSLITQYGLATQYYANTHPSIGNYEMLTTGQVLTNDDTQTPSSFPISADNVVRELVAAGKSWKAYAESLPSVGYLGGDTTSGGGQYYVRHVPIAYLTDVQNSSAQQQNLVPFTQLAQDLSSGNLSNYSFITPNGCDDAHDCGLSTADNWLKSNIDPLIKNATFQKDGLLIVVFDESSNDNTNGGGRVVCVLISPAFSKLGYQSTTIYQHQSLLRLTLEGLGVTVLPGAASNAPAMWEFFNTSGGTPAAPSITTTSLPAGTVGQAYSTQLNATGGRSPYTWSLSWLSTGGAQPFDCRCDQRNSNHGWLPHVHSNRERCQLSNGQQEFSADGGGCDGRRLRSLCFAFGVRFQSRDALGTLANSTKSG